MADSDSLSDSKSACADREARPPLARCDDDDDDDGDRGERVRCEELGDGGESVTLLRELPLRPRFCVDAGDLTADGGGAGGSTSDARCCVLLGVVVDSSSSSSRALFTDVRFVADARAASCAVSLPSSSPSRPSPSLSDESEWEKTTALVGVMISSLSGLTNFTDLRGEACVRGLAVPAVVCDGFTMASDEKWEGEMFASSHVSRCCCCCDEDDGGGVGERWRD